MINVLVSRRENYPALVKQIQIRMALFAQIQLIADQQRVVVLRLNGGSNTFIVQLDSEV